MLMALASVFVILLGAAGLGLLAWGIGLGADGEDRALVATVCLLGLVLICGAACLTVPLSHAEDGVTCSARVASP